MPAPHRLPEHLEVWEEGAPTLAESTALRTCVICTSEYTPRTGSQKTCDGTCSRELRLRTVRAVQLRSYKTRPLRSDSSCHKCSASIPAPRTGPLRKWCDRCRAANEIHRASRRRRQSNRSCHKCGVHVPEHIGKPGRPVCASCRVDRRDSEANREREARRRFRKYGITQEQYDTMLESQGGCCVGCGTDTPGVKGWCIDHCHASGDVRAILCHRCNTMLGLADEDPVTLRRLADLVEKFKKED